LAGQAQLELALIQSLELVKAMALRQPHLVEFMGQHTMDLTLVKIVQRAMALQQLHLVEFMGQHTMGLTLVKIVQLAMALQQLRLVELKGQVQLELELVKPPLELAKAMALQ
jgi:hypothetical protein